MDRRRFLARSIAAAGTLAAAGKVGWPKPAFAATDHMSNVYSKQPCRYVIRELMQDARNNGGMALGNPVFAPQGDHYRIKMCWEPRVLPDSRTDAIGGMTFRAGDDQNFYYLVFFPVAVAFPPAEKDRPIDSSAEHGGTRRWTRALSAGAAAQMGGTDREARRVAVQIRQAHARLAQDQDRP